MDGRDGEGSACDRGGCRMSSPYPRRKQGTTIPGRRAKDRFTGSLPQGIATLAPCIKTCALGAFPPTAMGLASSAKTRRASIGRLFMTPTRDDGSSFAVTWLAGPPQTRMSPPWSSGAPGHSHTCEEHLRKDHAKYLITGPKPRSLRAGSRTCETLGSPGSLFDRPVSLEVLPSPDRAPAHS